MGLVPSPARAVTRAGIAVAATAALTLGLAGSASAATATRTVTVAGTTYHLSLTAPETAAAAGETVTVSGSGYNPDQGIFVALRAVYGNVGDNTPTPGLGGSAGIGGASYLVSNRFGGQFPQSTTYGPGGTFTVSINVRADLGDGNICGETVECAIVTRADFTNIYSRSYDVHVPITFQ